MSDFKLTDITKVKSGFILSKFAPINDVTIIGFKYAINEIDNEYNKSFPFWFIIVTKGSCHGNGP